MVQKLENNVLLTLQIRETLDINQNKWKECKENGRKRNLANFSLQQNASNSADVASSCWRQRRIGIQESPKLIEEVGVVINGFTNIPDFQAKDFTGQVRILLPRFAGRIGGWVSGEVEQELCESVRSQQKVQKFLILAFAFLKELILIKKFFQSKRIFLQNGFHSWDCMKAKRSPEAHFQIKLKETSQQSLQNLSRTTSTDFFLKKSRRGGRESRVRGRQRKPLCGCDKKPWSTCDDRSLMCCDVLTSSIGYILECSTTTGYQIFRPASLSVCWRCSAVEVRLKERMWSPLPPWHLLSSLSLLFSRFGHLI